MVWYLEKIIFETLIAISHGGGTPTKPPIMNGGNGAPTQNYIDMGFEKFIKANGGDEKVTFGQYATRTAPATSEDAEMYGLAEEQEYTCWVVIKDGKTQKGTPVKKGQFFFTT